MNTWRAVAFALFMPLPCAASTLEQQFAACLQDAVLTFPGVDPYQDFVRSMHLPRTNFDRRLSACMQSHGFAEPDMADRRCLDPARLENEAYCYAKPYELAK